MRGDMKTTAQTKPLLPALPAFEGVLDALADPVLLVDDDENILWSNAASQEALDIGVHGIDLRRVFQNFSHDMGSTAKPVQLKLVTSADQPFDATVSRVGAGHFLVHLRRGSVVQSQGPGEIDELTGAAKRNALLRAIEVEFTAETGGQFALHCLDLDRFKMINDTLGHGVGDLLLKKVADRLRSACRASDVVARIGGDEFVVLQRQITSSDDAERFAARLVDLVGRTYVLNGHTINIGASVGVALKGERLQARDVLRDADLALYEAKRAGKSRYRLFEPFLSVSLRERRELEIDLRRALALKQFELNYQPFVELESNNVGGFEALLRWHHPVRGTVPPLDFIPMAEETGLIVKIGEWVLRTACAQAATWPGNMTVAVNVSPLQFKADNLLDTVRSALQQAGLAPERLELEITESALLDDTNNVLTTLHALRSLGVKISMDDFGTGYSSLSYLQKFPFDKIKIDRSFVAGDSADSQAILRAVAGLGTSLGMAITAEGVETMTQLEHVRGHLCTHVQGYFTGRPMSGPSISQFLQANEKAGNNV